MSLHKRLKSTAIKLLSTHLYSQDESSVWLFPLLPLFYQAQTGIGDAHFMYHMPFLYVIFPVFFICMCGKKRLRRLHTDQEDSTDTSWDFVTPQIQWSGSRSPWADAQEYRLPLNSRMSFSLLKNSMSSKPSRFPEPHHVLNVLTQECIEQKKIKKIISTLVVRKFSFLSYILCYFQCILCLNQMN